MPHMFRCLVGVPASAECRLFVAEFIPSPNHTHVQKHHRNAPHKSSGKAGGKSGRYTRKSVHGILAPGEFSLAIGANQGFERLHVREMRNLGQRRLPYWNQIVIVARIALRRGRVTGKPMLFPKALLPAFPADGSTGEDEPPPGEDVFLECLATRIPFGFAQPPGTGPVQLCSVGPVEDAGIVARL